jgi:hypothetical protein
MSDFLKSHFDKLLLTGLLLTLFFATIHTLHHGTDTVAVNWLENTVGQVLAALLTLMVGQRLTQRNGDLTSSTPNQPPLLVVPGGAIGRVASDTGAVPASTGSTAAPVGKLASATNTGSPP